MKLIDWLRPGIKGKTMGFTCHYGNTSYSFGLLEFVNHHLYSIYYIAFYIFLILIGIFVIYISASQGNEIYYCTYK